MVVDRICAVIICAVVFPCKQLFKVSKGLPIIFANLLKNRKQPSCDGHNYNLEEQPLEM